jgi:membrane protein insertase Oxa1/YidC/SpoIIIJ
MGFILKWVLIIGIIYYILNRYIFPIFRITVSSGRRMEQMQQQIRDMEQKLNQQQATRKTRRRSDGDYIDYEEMKK